MQLGSLPSEFLSVSSSKVDKPSQDSLPCGLSQRSPERSPEIVMLQRLLISLPAETSSWVKLHHPEKAPEGAPLWEDVPEMSEGEGENRRWVGGRKRNILEVGKESGHLSRSISWGDSWVKGLCSSLIIAPSVGFSIVVGVSSS